MNPASSPEATHFRPTDADRKDGRITWMTFLNVLLRRRGVLALTVLALLSIVAVRGVMHSYTYTASASFMAQAQQQSSAAAGIAAQLGVALPGADQGSSPQFYVDLLKSRRILREVVGKTYTYPRSTGVMRGTLVQAFGLAHLPAPAADASARGMLAQTINTSIGRTGIVSLEVTTTSAELSRQIAANLLAALDRFNRETRQTQAAAERRFTEERLAQASAALRAAEDRLRRFLEENRGIGSPRLMVERERLSRDVETRQGVYTVLAQAYERAKIDEVRDSPVITVIEPAETHAYPNNRGLLKRLAIAGIVGVLLGGFLALLIEYLSFSRGRTTDAEAEFVRLRGEAVRDLQRPWRFFTRL